MKTIFTISFLLIQLLCFSQQKDSLNVSNKKITFITKFNIDEDAAKGDVFYLNEYIVHISWNKAQKFNGKTIRVSGKVSIVKGIGKTKPSKQGYSADTKHIFNPKIKIVKE